MKSHRKILIAFLLNLFFSVVEFVGGILIGSVAILSDSIHDMGDAMSIGISFLFEKKSTKKPDDNYTYGYSRYSVIGSVIMTLVLLIGSCVIIYNAIRRIISPTPINYNAMIILAVIGSIVNLTAVLVTKDGHSLNQKAVNLHMLEDVLGWIVVLIGAIVMKFTDFAIIDPILSIGVAIFILINAIKNLSDSLSVFLEKTPKGININDIRETLLENEEIIDVHHIHIWSMDGDVNYATMHVVTDFEAHSLKTKVRSLLKDLGISHVTLEIESPKEDCSEKVCTCNHSDTSHHHHHHHHHH